MIPTVDFLNYFAQLLPVLDQDETLIGASAWNENGTSQHARLPTMLPCQGKIAKIGSLPMRFFISLSVDSKNLLIFFMTNPIV